MISRLETPAGHPPPGEFVPECNAALEACLEVLRDIGDRDDLTRKARSDLKRLSRLLKLVDDVDVLFVIRQIRRVVGRLQR